MALLAYAALFGLGYLVVLLPGGSASLGPPRLVVASIVIEALIVWGLAHGSALAWAIGLLIALSGAALIFLAAGPLDWKVIAIVTVSLAQAVLLLTQPLRGHVLSRPHAPLP